MRLQDGAPAASRRPSPPSRVPPSRPTAAPCTSCATATRSRWRSTAARRASSPTSAPVPRPSTRRSRSGSAAGSSSSSATSSTSVRDRARADSVARAERKAREAAGLQPVYIAATERVAAIEVSPNGRAALVSSASPPRGSGRPRCRSSSRAAATSRTSRPRTKVGDAIGQPARALDLASLRHGDAAPGVRPGQRAAASWPSAAGTTTARAPRCSRIAGQPEAAQLLSVRSDTAAFTTVETLRDTAWVGGPCSSCAGWYDGGRRLWFVSEATGYAQLYSADAAGGDVRALTDGKWEVLDVDLSPDERSSTSRPTSRRRRRAVLSHARDRRRAHAHHDAHPAGMPPCLARRTVARRRVLVRQPAARALPRGERAGRARRRGSRRARARSGSGFRGSTPALVQIPAVRRRRRCRRTSIARRTWARAEWRGGDLRARRRLPAQRRQLLVGVSARVHVQPVPRVARLRRARPRLPRVRRLRPRLAHCDLPLHGRARSPGSGRCVEVADEEVRHRPGAHRHLRRQLRRLHHADGAVHRSRTTSARAPHCDASPTGRTTTTATPRTILNLPQNDTLAYRRSSPIYFAEGLRVRS